MNKKQYEQMMDGLVKTAIEKVISMGKEDSDEDIERVKEVIKDFELFWNGDGELSDYDWENEIKQNLKKLNGEI